MKIARVLIVPILVASVNVSMQGTSLAADDDTMKATSRTLLTVPPSEAQPLARASELLGKPVKDSDGTTLGKVSDVVLTADRSKIAYLAVTVPEHSDQFRAMALNDLRMTSDGSAFVCTTPRADLAKLATFPRNTWPESASESAVRDAEQRARNLTMPGADERTETTRAGTTAFNNRLVSHLIGMEVRGPTDKNVCRIRDLIVVMDQGRIKEATVGVGGVMGVGEKLASVDWSSVKIPTGASYAQVTLSEDDLQKVAFSEKEYWQNAGFVKPEKGGFLRK